MVRSKSGLHDLINECRAKPVSVRLSREKAHHGVAHTDLSRALRHSG